MAYASPVFGSNVINDIGYTQDALSTRRLASVTSIWTLKRIPDIYRGQLAS